ncbi:MAG: outer membrane protein transport protein [Flavobacteriaceae bacterium]
MKRKFTFIIVLICAVASAQNIQDVLRYSSENLLGTARYQAMSGAFGALGGDMSAINVNPASSAVFKNSLFAITGAAYNNKNETSYFGTFRNSNLTSWKFNQIGGAFVWKNNQKSWKKISLAFNYDLANNFDDEFFASGTNFTGIDTYFLNLAQGLPFGSLLIRDNEFIEDAYLRIGSSLGYGPQQAFLGYFGGVINPVDETDLEGTDYVSNAEYTNVFQDYYQSTRGYNSKFTVNLAGQYEDFLFIGGSMNFNSVYFEKFSRFDETGYDSGSALQFVNFDNLLVTRGNAFSFNLGAIAKLNNSFRLGASYQSPIWYDLRDDLSQRINSNLADDDIGFINFSLINVFERYQVKTPSKFTGSAAIVFGKQGLISFDYSYQDMSKAQLRPTGDPSFNTVNTQIASELGSIDTFRVGGEYRLDNVSLRAGYRYEGSPYLDGFTIGDLQGFSGGFGINFGGSRLDFAYSRTERDVTQQLFDTGVTSSALINQIRNNYVMSYTINF